MATKEANVAQPSADEGMSEEAPDTNKYTFEKYCQLRGPAIDEYEKAYLRGLTRGTTQTLAEWDTTIQISTKKKE